ncbi:hypothetical protein METY_1253 [Methylopila sp. Yamaguchi]|nr:hypothetical protein METY_1253 [Methylopila sp. Yamaguchi]
MKHARSFRAYEAQLERLLLTVWIDPLERMLVIALFDQFHTAAKDASMSELIRGKFARYADISSSSNFRCEP